MGEEITTHIFFAPCFLLGMNGFSLSGSELAKHFRGFSLRDFALHGTRFVYHFMRPWICNINLYHILEHTFYG